MIQAMISGALRDIAGRRADLLRRARWLQLQ